MRRGPGAVERVVRLVGWMYSDVELPEPPETPVVQLRRPSAVVEGVEGRGARRIKYTPKFQSITDTRKL